MLDRATDVRPGEELPLDALNAHLQAHTDAVGRIVEVKQYPGGFSNLTYQLLDDYGKEYVLRRPPRGANIKSAHDMSREWRFLTALDEVWPYVPKPMHCCQDEAVLGASFYIMEKMNGVILRARPPKDIDLTPELMRRLSTATVDRLVELHTIDVDAYNLIDLGKPTGYAQRQIDGWVRRYYKAETDELPAMNQLAEWLGANVPQTQGRVALIHNDYKYDNLVLNPIDPAHILAVLDWEMATIGDPLMDLGTTLGYWTESHEAKLNPLAASNLTYLPGNLTRREVADRYAERSGSPVDNLVFYYVYGTFKIGVILQQIYARWKAGYSTDPRFGQLIHGVRLFAATGTKALEKDRISGL